ncbi:MULTISPECIES: hypothetical protein [Lactobacillales]|uniref:hypothetical protein n=1 Tax=Lactobacillales TaxID=186826 RepID=UPI001C8C5B4C|nr:hypothetical protein [Enterococcus faecalis]MBX9006075.1 hypothetical protein [Enterococcus faecalis]
MSGIEHLFEEVLDASVSSDWDEAVNEWDVVGIDEDGNHDTSCICGKEGLRYLFTIQNRFNGNELFPIGSKCIGKFERADLDLNTATYQKLFELFNEYERNKFISLKSGMFSRKLLEFLYNDGAFKPTVYNGSDPYKDYEFLLSMFNKREENITKKQNGKIKAILLNQIVPYIQTKMGELRRSE